MRVQKGEAHLVISYETVRYVVFARTEVVFSSLPRRKFVCDPVFELLA